MRKFFSCDGGYIDRPEISPKWIFEHMMCTDFVSDLFPKFFSCFPHSIWFWSQETTWLNEHSHVVVNKILLQNISEVVPSIASVTISKSKRCLDTMKQLLRLILFVLKLPQLFFLIFFFAIRPTTWFNLMLFISTKCHFKNDTLAIEKWWKSIEHQFMHANLKRKYLCMFLHWIDWKLFSWYVK